MTSRDACLRPSIRCGLIIALLFGGVGLTLLLLQPLWGKVSDIVGRVPVMFYGILSILGVITMAALFWGQIIAPVPISAPLM